jgi:hypothetical protein
MYIILKISTGATDAYHRGSDLVRNAWGEAEVPQRWVQRWVQRDRPTRLRAS